MKKYRIAIYMRLSKEDDKKKEESSSISNQRMMLQKYVNENFSAYELMEFADDGYTGTNFNRPGMQQMLEQVKNAAIDCIIVKDFSRFARDYIELGSYLEQIFPFMGVRFISVNDHYDSKNYKGSIAELDVNFKNLLYDLYSKDLSQKVKSSLAIRKARGEYVSGNCPFGYEKSPDDRHQLLIEEDEAAIVRRIFELTVQGCTSVQIAKLFNEEKVKTPIEFKMEKGRTTRIPKGNVFLWNASFICQVLRNRVYVGDIVYGKYEKDFVGGKNHMKPRKQWKIFYNHHEPVIEWNVFEQVQAKRGKNRAAQSRETHPLVGKAVCGCCGRNLRYRPGLNPYFCCNYRYYNGLEQSKEGFACVEQVNVMYLEQYMLFMMQEKLLENGELEKLTQEHIVEVCGKIKDLKDKKRMLFKECEKQKLENFEAYQKFAVGKAESFQSRESRIKALERELEMLNGEITKQEEYYRKQMYDRKNLYLEEPYAALSKEMIDRYIRRIVVFDEQNLEIEWRFEGKEGAGVSH